MRSKWPFLLAHSEFYEPLSRHEPDLTHYFDRVAALIPRGWAIERDGIWFHCSGPRSVSPREGWKIHLSATLAHAHKILEATVPLLASADVCFKFALDPVIHGVLNSKIWHRGGAGKFITVYPSDGDHFLALLPVLRESTKSLEGPYILSDRRYPGSSVVFYRFGGIRPRMKVELTGRTTHLVRTPTGGEIEDRRLAGFVLPPGVADPFPEAECDDAVGLKGGRYLIEEPLSYRTSGGVYKARDTATGDIVVIKEARPHISWTRTIDAIATLKKEYRVLQKIEHLRIAPAPLDLFQDWEHWFLVEELVEGMLLQSYTARTNVLLRYRPSTADCVAHLREYVAIFSTLAQHLAALHRLGIVFGDLSPSNVLVQGRAERIALIDFEAAHEVGEDDALPIFTPGFAPTDSEGRPSAPSDSGDSYSLGALMISTLFPMTELFTLKPTARHELLAALSADLGLPRELRELIAGLTAPDRYSRPTPAAASTVLRGVGTPTAPVTPADAPDDTVGMCRQMALDTIRHALSVADYSRRDRLFPADPELFSTNPVSLAYGAAGVAYACLKVSGECPAEVLDWILSHDLTADSIPPGLYVGKAGIAWVLLEAGLEDPARRLLSRAAADPRLSSAADLFYGLSGVGLAQLRFFAGRQEESHLSAAIRCAQRIEELAIEQGTGVYWKWEDRSYFGLAHGASGVALFLIYLYRATGNERWLRLGRSALQWEIEHATVIDQVRSWPHHSSRKEPLLSYWRYGSAGIGSVIVRYEHVLGNGTYAEVLEEISHDTERKWTAFPGRFLGLAGIGEFRLDWAFLLADEHSMRVAKDMARHLRLFAIPRPGGVAFPGDGLMRVSCDLGTGGAGIALFLNRLVDRTSSAFTLDDHYFARPVAPTEPPLHAGSIPLSTA